MVNNLGATPPLEMSLVARTALSSLEEQYKVGRTEQYIVWDQLL